MRRAAFLVVAVGAASYFACGKNKLLWDDWVVLRGLAQAASPADFFRPSYWNSLPPGERPDYRPVRSLSVAADQWLWGGREGAYHATSVALHVFTALTVCLWAGHLARSRWVAVTAALIFASHPALSEAVLSLESRAEILAGLLVLVALQSFTEGRLGIRRFGGSLAAFVGALCAKLSALVAPLLLGMASFVHGRPKDLPRRGAALLAFAAVGVGFLAFVRYAIQPGYVWTTELTGITPLERTWLVFHTIGAYVWLLLFPVHLNADRLVAMPGKGVLIALGGMALVSAWVVVCLWRGWRRRRLWAFAALFILVALVPASNLKLLSLRPIAEERLYLPCVGYALLLSFVAAATRARKGRAATLLALVAVNSALVAQRTLVWANAETLWRDTVRKSYGKARAHNNLGLVYAETGRLGPAMREFRKAIRNSTGYADAYANLGQALLARGRKGEARDRFRRALSFDPTSAKAWVGMARLFRDAGDLHHAEEAYRRAVDGDPFNATAYAEWAEILAKTGRDFEAANCLRRAIVLSPQVAAYYFNLGNLLRKFSNPRGALACYLRAVELSPSNYMAHFNAAEMLETAGQADLARRHYEAVLAIDPANWRAHVKLAEIAEASGRAEAAMRHWQAARERAPQTVRQKIDAHLRPR